MIRQRRPDDGALMTRKDSCCSRQEGVKGSCAAVTPGLHGFVVAIAQQEPRSRSRGEASPIGARSDGLVHVPLLRWPSERTEATRLEAKALPFLLLVGRDEVPPRSGYRFMDWVRSPVDPDELIARQSNLEARFILSLEGQRPFLDDESGRLAFGHGCVDVAPSQTPLLRVFVDSYREVVCEDRVRRVLGVDGSDREVLAGRLVRLRRRVRLAGLDINRVRGVGYALEPLSPF